MTNYIHSETFKQPQKTYHKNQFFTDCKNVKDSVMCIPSCNPTKDVYNFCQIVWSFRLIMTYKPSI